MDVKSFFVGDQNAGHGDRIAEAWRGRQEAQNGFAGLGGHSLNKYSKS